MGLIPQLKSLNLIRERFDMGEQEIGFLFGILPDNSGESRHDNY